MVRGFAFVHVSQVLQAPSWAETIFHSSRADVVPIVNSAPAAPLTPSLLYALGCCCSLSLSNKHQHHHTSLSLLLTPLSDMLR